MEEISISIPQDTPLSEAGLSNEAISSMVIIYMISGTKLRKDCKRLLQRLRRKENPKPISQRKILELSRIITVQDFQCAAKRASNPDRWAPRAIDNIFQTQSRLLKKAANKAGKQHQRRQTRNSNLVE